MWNNMSLNFKFIDNFLNYNYDSPNSPSNYAFTLLKRSQCIFNLYQGLGHTAFSFVSSWNGANSECENVLTNWKSST